MPRPIPFHAPTACLAIVVAVSCLLMSPADAQSDASRRGPEASALAVVEIPASVGHALGAGGKVMVTGVVASGTGVALTVSAVGTGASFVVAVATETAHELSLVPGRTLAPVGIDGGWLLMADGEVVCFVANDAARQRIHSREIDA